MPYANSQGVRIHYQIEGAGVLLVLQHGFTDSLESWYEQGYVEGLRDAYQLILIDARDHGASDKPHEPTAYDFQCNVADILAVLDALHIPAAHFLGYSMGGQIGFALAQYAAARFASLIIGGQIRIVPTVQNTRHGSRRCSRVAWQPLCGFGSNRCRSHPRCAHACWRTMSKP